MVEKTHQKRTGTKKAVSWKLDTDIIDLLVAISDQEGESQASILRGLIKKEAKRLGVTKPMIPQ